MLSVATTDTDSLSTNHLTDRQRHKQTVLDSIDTNHCHPSHHTLMEVHRLRIGNYLPKAIKSIAVDHIYSQKIAIGREDGDIEVGQQRLL